MRAKFILSALLLFGAVAGLQAKKYDVKSPDGKLTLSVENAATATWSLSVDGVTVTSGNRLGMELVNPDGVTRILGDKASVKKAVRGKASSEVVTPFYRQKSVKDEYNYLILKMKGGFSLELRAYNQGVAYRFVTDIKDSIVVMNEFFEFRTGGTMDAIIPYQTRAHSASKDIYESSFENEYTYVQSAKDLITDRFAFLPMLADTRGNGKLLLLESDIVDYPGMYFKTEETVWTAVFPPISEAFTYSKRWNQRRSDYGDVIANTVGTRTFPWRIIAYAAEDKDLPANDLTWLLSSPSKVDDISWIEPGLSSWDWWNDFKLLGVDFPCGINTETYRYHVDFAARFGLKYILVDEGWYKAPHIFDPIPQMDIKGLCDYAQSKGIKVVLWSTGGLVDMHGAEKVCEHYSSLGVDGFKLDFFDGQDQLTVQQITRLAAATAKYHMILDLHGMYKPSGFNRTWPHVLGFEGVYGAENLGHRGINLPLYDVTFPYLRQVSGPTDYTPGAMQSAAMNEKKLVARGGASQGTRAHQIALYVVLDQPFGILCDTPSLYEREPETTSYIASIPTVFDKTFIQSGKIGESIVSVRQKDGKWYVGGLTDWNARDVKVDFSFLADGKWKASIYRDGANADKYGEDFILSTIEVDNTTVLPVHMAQGGGFAIVLEKD